jgi:MFS family permease
MPDKQSDVGQMLARFSWPRTLRALRHRNFRLFWFAQAISLTGAQMQLVALSWLAYRLTNSPLILGLIGLVALLPVGLITLVGGVISDRLPRRRLIIAMQTILAFQALILTLLAWAELVQVWHIMVFTFVVGAADALEQPARFSFLMDAVGREDFTSAVGLNAAIVSAARAFGPAIAGMLISWSGEASCFLWNSVTYLLVIIAFLSMRLPAQDGPREPVHLKADLLAGLKYAWENDIIKGTLVLSAASFALARSYLVLMPVFAQDVVQTDARGYGLLMSAVGLGSVCGALAAANVKRRHQGSWLVRAVLVFPVILLLFAASSWLVSSIVLLVLAGTSQYMQEVLCISLIQLAATNEFQGRMVSFFSLFANGLTRLGGIPIGAVAQWWSAPGAVGSGAILSLTWLLIVLWQVPSVRHMKVSN